MARAILGQGKPKPRTYGSYGGHVRVHLQPVHALGWRYQLARLAVPSVGGL
jgi:hypothetical protein